MSIFTEVLTEKPARSTFNVSHFGCGSMNTVVRFGDSEERSSKQKTFRKQFAENLNAALIGAAVGLWACCWGRRAFWCEPEHGRELAEG